MKVALYIKKEGLKGDSRILAVSDALRAGGADVCGLSALSDLVAGTDILVSFGGDGTFLSAAAAAYPLDVPILGVNLGRMGFLAGGSLDNLAPRILAGDWRVEEREVLSADGNFALNEVTIARTGTNTIGVDVDIDGNPLPTYWADGLVVATTSGSTAYNLSVGGPICIPGTRVIVISPIAPHNLGVRPLVIPDTSVVRLSVKSRRGGAVFSCDNRSMLVPDGFTVEVVACEKPLKCVKIGDTNFIDALRSRFFWGQDVRNSTEQY